MKFSIGMGSTLTTAEVAAHAAAAEEAGFSHLTLVDTPSMSRDVHVMMMLAVQATKHIRIGQGVVDPRSIHPSVIANLSASINELSGGRVFVGLGTGNPVAKMRKPATLAELRDSVEFVRQFTAGEEARYHGVSYQSRWSRARLPVYVSAHGPKSLELAGAIADGVIFVATHPVYARWQLGLIRRGAVKAGRDPAAVDTWARTMIYITDDMDSARAQLAAYPASYKELHKLLCRDDPDVEELRKALQADEPGSVDHLIADSRRFDAAFDMRYAELIGAPHADAVSWRLINFWHLAGSADSICARIDALEAAGVSTVSMTIYTITDTLGMIRQVGEQIISHYSGRTKSTC